MYEMCHIIIFYHSCKKNDEKIPVPMIAEYTQDHRGWTYNIHWNIKYNKQEQNDTRYTQDTQAYVAALQTFSIDLQSFSSFRDRYCLLDDHFIRVYI